MKTVATLLPMKFRIIKKECCAFFNRNRFKFIAFDRPFMT